MWCSKISSLYVSRQRSVRNLRKTFEFMLSNVASSVNKISSKSVSIMLSEFK